MGEDYLFDVRLRLSLDGDWFLNDLCILPLSLELVPMGILGMQFLYEQILAVGECQGHPPGDVGIVAYQHHRHAWKGGSSYVEQFAFATGCQVDDVPDAWCTQCKVHVIAQKGRASGSPAAADRPSVAAKTTP